VKARGVIRIVAAVEFALLFAYVLVALRASERNPLFWVLLMSQLPGITAMGWLDARADTMSEWMYLPLLYGGIFVVQTAIASSLIIAAQRSTELIARRRGPR